MQAEIDRKLHRQNKCVAQITLLGMSKELTSSITVYVIDIGHIICNSCKSSILTGGLSGSVSIRVLISILTRGSPTYIGPYLRFRPYLRSARPETRPRVTSDQATIIKYQRLYSYAKISISAPPPRDLNEVTRVWWQANQKATMMDCCRLNGRGIIAFMS